MSRQYATPLHPQTLTSDPGLSSTRNSRDHTSSWLGIDVDGEDDQSGIMSAEPEVAKQVHEPAPGHCKAAHRVLEYLNTARSLGTRFSVKRKGEVIACAGTK